MKKLIINADDFGLNEEVMQAICELYDSGLISSSSCMTNMPAWPQAAAYLRQHPDFAAGVHLVFNDGYPVLPGQQVPALLGEDGRFLSDQQIMWGFKPGTSRQLFAELQAQIERFIQDVGFLPDHLDNHCPVSYVRPDRFKITLDLAQEYKLPIRAPFGDDFEDKAPILAANNNYPIWQIHLLGRFYRHRVDRADIPHPNSFIQHFSSSSNQTPESLLEVLDNLRDGWTTELLVHPGYDGGWREQDLRALRDPRVRQRLAEPDIELVNFKSLQHP
jgi:predicted glycoside hydrolase/deacetylase ChbG (UPF0249 family)